MTGDDLALVERLRRGEAAAFAETFERYADRLYRVALGVLRDADEAEDAVQEAFITLSQRLDTFEGRSRLGTWLYRVAYNAALQRARAAGRRSSREARGARDLEAVEERVPDAGPTPTEAIERRDDGARLDAAIGALPETLRAAFLLRDVEGLSTTEAAELLDITPSALKVRLHRARLALRDLVSDAELPAMTTAAGMSCPLAVEQMSAYLDGQLDTEARARLEAHVRECDHCQVRVDTTRRTLELAGARRHVTLPAPRSGDLFERLAAVFAARPAGASEDAM